MRWYAILFWVWVVVSLGVFLWRRINGSGDDDSIVVDDQPSPALTKVWAPPPPDPDAAPTSGVGDDSPTPVAVEPPSPTTADSPDASRTPPTTGTTAGVTLAELLSGITLPLGLVPLTQSAPTSGPATSIVVATDAAGPEQVGTELADEIEALGYTVRSTGEHTAVAEGPRGAVEIEIHPHAGAVGEGGVHRFPTAKENSVVVELRVAGTQGD